ncbi:hypothetical protein GPNCGGLF_LOCUS4040 [Methylorubrum aminovorans]
MMASLSTDSAVDLGWFGSVFRSSVENRVLYSATIFGLTP